MSFVNVIAYAGKVQLWGGVDSSEQHAAARIAAEVIVGVGRIENNLGVFSQTVQASMWAQ